MKSSAGWAQGNKKKGRILLRIRPVEVQDKLIALVKGIGIELTVIEFHRLGRVPGGYQEPSAPGGLQKPAVQGIAAGIR